MEVDIAEVHVLEETLRKVAALSSSITTSLNSVAQNSHYAERAIRPISGRNYKLKLYSENLSSSLAVINDIKEYATLTAECNNTLQKSPAETGLDKYLEATAAVSQAASELTKSHLRKFYKVTQRAEQLVDISSSTLRSYLDQLLAEVYVPFDAVSEIRSNPHADVAASLLAENPTQLELLRKLYLYFESVNKSHIFESCWVDAATKFILQSAPKADAALDDSKSAPSNDSSVSVNKHVSDSLALYTTCLSKLIIGRAEDVELLIINADEKPDRAKSWLFRLVDNCLNDFISMVKTQISLASSNIQENSTRIFDIIDCVVKLQSPLTIIFGRKVARLTDALDMAIKTAQTVFPSMIAYIDSQVQLANMTAGETGVTGVTLKVMSQVRKLADKKESVMAAIENVKPGSWIPSPRPAWASILTHPLAGGTGPDDAMSLLSTYFSDCFECLILSHEVKAKAIGKRDFNMGLLLLSNLAFIDETIRQGELRSILSELGNERLQKMRKHCTNLYLSGWNQAATHLMDTTTAKKALSSKDRDVIKEKFKTFNAEIEELVRQHKQQKISNPTLRSELAREVLFISPLYHRFHDRHRGGDFSKNPDKYIRWDKEQFDAMLASL